MSALRRRGYPPEAVNMFCGKVGVTMAQTTTDISLLEACVRTVLNQTAPRAMAVLEPLKITIENFPLETKIECTAPNFPGDESKGSHLTFFDKVVYIDSCDFVEVILKALQPLFHINIQVFVTVVDRIQQTKALNV